MMEQNEMNVSAAEVGSAADKAAATEPHRPFGAPPLAEQGEAWKGSPNETELRGNTLISLARAAAPTPRIILDRLAREAAELAGEYPALDLAAELRDERFRRLVRGGATLGGAYAALHPEAVRDAAARSIYAHLRARGMRPAENGTQRHAAATVSLAAQSPRGRAELARRAENGERIMF